MKSPLRSLLVFLAATFLFNATAVILLAQESEPQFTRLLESGDAYIAHDPKTNNWEIGTNSIRRRMAYAPGTGFRMTRLTNKVTGKEWLATKSAASSELRVVIDNQTIIGSTSDLLYKNFKTEKLKDNSLELVVTFQRGALNFHTHYLIYPRTSVIEQWVEVENTGSEVIPHLTAIDSFSVALRPSADPLTLYWIHGLDPSAEDKTSLPVPALRQRSLKIEEGKVQDLGSSGRSTEEEMAWFALVSPKLREGIFGGIEWTGAWYLRVSGEGGNIVLRGGIDALEHDLQPGELFDGPRRFVGFFQGDLDDAANASNNFARLYLLRPRPANFPWTQYNSWFAFYTNITEEKLKKQVDVAAELGLEIFYVDAGWYEGSPERADFSFGLGSWRENREKFPSGLAKFAEYVKSKGMKFGLWVEPERVDLRYVGADKEIQREWLPRWQQFPDSVPPDQVFTTQICLGNREAVEWMKKMLAGVIRDYQVEWLKWDNNMPASCDLPGEPGDQNYFHYKGLYQVLDFIRKEFPSVIVENCAAGGNRMDYAMMRRTDVAWLSDETDPSYRVRHHMAGASYAFPPEYLNSWIVESYFEHFGDAEDNPDLMRAWLRSRMMGAFGISREISDVEPGLRAVIADEIKRYKETRAILTRSRVYRLFPQHDLDEHLEPPEEPDAAQFYDPVSRNGLVYLFQGSEVWSERKVLLRGLNPNLTYKVESYRRELSITQTGRELMTQGVTFTYDDHYPSTVLTITSLVPVGTATPTRAAPTLTTFTPEPTETPTRAATATLTPTITPTRKETNTRAPTPTKAKPTITTPTRAPTKTATITRTPTNTRTLTPTR